MYTTKTVPGFTLVEILLVIALLGIMAGISIPLYYTFQLRNNLDLVSSSYAHTLRRAQALTRAVDGDISWGVHLTATTTILFKGISFAARQSDFDEISDIPISIFHTGLGDVVFAKFTGFPQQTGTTTFTSTDAESRAVAINGKGIVSY